MKAALLVLLLSFLGAPFQCASDPDPARRMEDTPSEALWHLAERFREQGRGEAREETLREIVRAYPSSREAERSRQILHLGPASNAAEVAPGGGDADDCTDCEDGESNATPAVDAPSP